MKNKLLHFLLFEKRIAKNELISALGFLGTLGKKKKRSTEESKTTFQQTTRSKYKP